MPFNIEPFPLQDLRGLASFAPASLSMAHACCALLCTPAPRDTPVPPPMGLCTHILFVPFTPCPCLSSPQATGSFRARHDLLLSQDSVSSPVEQAPITRPPAPVLLLSSSYRAMIVQVFASLIKSLSNRLHVGRAHS